MPIITWSLDPDTWRNEYAKQLAKMHTKRAPVLSVRCKINAHGFIGGSVAMFMAYGPPATGEGTAYSTMEMAKYDYQCFDLQQGAATIEATLRDARNSAFCRTDEYDKSEGQYPRIVLTTMSPLFSPADYASDSRYFLIPADGLHPEFQMWGATLETTTPAGASGPYGRQTFGDLTGITQPLLLSTGGTQYVNTCTARDYLFGGPLTQAAPIRYSSVGNGGAAGDFNAIRKVTGYDGTSTENVQQFASADIEFGMISPAWGAHPCAQTPADGVQVPGTFSAIRLRADSDVLSAELAGGPGVNYISRGGVSYFATQSQSVTLAFDETKAVPNTGDGPEVSAPVKVQLGANGNFYCEQTCIQLPADNNAVSARGNLTYGQQIDYFATKGSESMGIPGGTFFHAKQRWRTRDYQLSSPAPLITYQSGNGKISPTSEVRAYLAPYIFNVVESIPVTTFTDPDFATQLYERGLAGRRFALLNPTSGERVVAVEFRRDADGFSISTAPGTPLNHYIDTPLNDLWVQEIETSGTIPTGTATWKPRLILSETATYGRKPAHDDEELLQALRGLNAPQGNIALAGVEYAGNAAMQRRALASASTMQENAFAQQLKLQQGAYANSSLLSAQNFEQQLELLGARTGAPQANARARSSGGVAPPTYNEAVGSSSTPSRDTTAELFSTPAESTPLAAQYRNRAPTSFAQDQQRLNSDMGFAESAYFSASKNPDRQVKMLQAQHYVQGADEVAQRTAEEETGQLIPSSDGWSSVRA